MAVRPIGHGQWLTLFHEFYNSARLLHRVGKAQLITMPWTESGDCCASQDFEGQ